MGGLLHRDVDLGAGPALGADLKALEHKLLPLEIGRSGVPPCPFAPAAGLDRSLLGELCVLMRDLANPRTRGTRVLARKGPLHHIRHDRRHLLHRLLKRQEPGLR